MINDDSPSAEMADEPETAEQLVTTDELDSIASSLDAVEAALSALDANDFDQAEQLVESLDAPSSDAVSEEE